MTEAVAKGCSVKKLFLNILQNSQESAYARVSFLITPFYIEHFRWLLFLMTTSEHLRKLLRTASISYIRSRSHIDMIIK